MSTTCSPSASRELSPRKTCDLPEEFHHGEARIATHTDTLTHRSFTNIAEMNHYIRHSCLQRIHPVLPWVTGKQGHSRSVVETSSGSLWSSKLERAVLSPAQCARALEPCLLLLSGQARVLSSELRLPAHPNTFPFQLSGRRKLLCHLFGAMWHLGEGAVPRAFLS